MNKWLVSMSAAAVAAGAVAVESANTVGVQEVSVPGGFSMRASTFRAISGDYKISDIKVSNDVLGGGGDYIQTVNEDGTWGDMFFYLTEAGTGYVPDGWYKDDFGGVPVTDEDVLTVGQALFITAASDISFTFAGQVIEGVPEVDAPTGFSMIGNPTPATATKISDIQVSNDVLGGGGDYIQTVNEDGTWGDMFFYLTEAGTGYVPDGWYKDDFGGVPVTDEDVLAAGEAVFVTFAGDATLSFPSVL